MKHSNSILIAFAAGIVLLALGSLLWIEGNDEGGRISDGGAVRPGSSLEASSARRESSKDSTSNLPPSTAPAEQGDGRAKTLDSHWVIHACSDESSEPHQRISGALLRAGRGFSISAAEGLASSQLPRLMINSRLQAASIPQPTDSSSTAPLSARLRLVAEELQESPEQSLVCISPRGQPLAGVPVIQEIRISGTALLSFMCTSNQEGRVPLAFSPKNPGALRGRLKTTATSIDLAAEALTAVSENEYHWVLDRLELIDVEVLRTDDSREGLALTGFLALLGGHDPVPFATDEQGLGKALIPAGAEKLSAVLTSKYLTAAHDPRVSVRGPTPTFALLEGSPRKIRIFASPMSVIEGFLSSRLSGFSLARRRVVLSSDQDRVLVDGEGPRWQASGSPRSTMTNAQGRFRFEEVAAGIARLSLDEETRFDAERLRSLYSVGGGEGAGANSATIDGNASSVFLKVEGGVSMAEIHLPVVPRPALRGTVVDASTGEPLRKARITARPHGKATLDRPSAIAWPSEVSVTSDEEGRFSISKLREGRWFLRVEAEGYPPHETKALDVHLGNPDASIRVALSRARLALKWQATENELTATETLTFRVLRERSPRLLSNAHESPYALVTCGAEGVQIDVGPGTYRISCVDPESSLMARGDTEKVITLGAGDSKQVVFDVRSASVFRGIIRMQDGTPASPGMAVLVSSQDSKQSAWFTPDADGRFKVKTPASQSMELHFVMVASMRLRDGRLISGRCEPIGNRRVPANGPVDFLLELAEPQ